MACDCSKMFEVQLTDVEAGGQHHLKACLGLEGLLPAWSLHMAGKLGLPRGGLSIMLLEGPHGMAAGFLQNESSRRPK